MNYQKTIRSILQNSGVLMVALACWINSQEVLAQTVTNVAKLQENARLAKEDYINNEKEIVRKAKERKLALKGYGLNGSYYWLHHFNERDEPVYYTTRSNVNSARSLRASRLWNGGGAGFNLEGQGMNVSANRSRLGMWEPGVGRTTHQEFGGRLVMRDGTAFTMHNGEASHATHVAGTMIASGVNADAKGIAPQASLDGYDAANDLSEMNTAASEGMLVSNHSYGPALPAAGQARDIARGYYDASARAWDNLCVNAPYYLPVQACGNDRDDGGGLTYDLLLGSSTAKNTLGVGAVEILPLAGYTNPASVVIGSFSSYGPTDDGRIKPDVVAPGVAINSSDSPANNSYLSQQGTSMAGPAAASALYLVQQHYKNVFNNTFMLSSTLRGLAIHTAEESGTSLGPDYSFGWGLLNVERCVEVINNTGNTHLLAQKSISNGATFTQSITTPGGQPLRVTICWTDPAATPLPNNATAIENRTSRLVNDLDVRILDATNNVITDLPWRLDPANPANAATKGDNTVDNVEQIYVANMPAGTYTIRVTHKGTLANEQAFAVIATGVTVPPAADFVASNRTICGTGTAINFTDNSIGATSWAWDINNDGTTDYTTRNPTHTYTTAGVYSVRLTINGGAATITKTNLIVVNAPITATAACPANTNLNNGFGIGISSFSLGSIRNVTSNNDGGYQNYTCTHSTVLLPNTSYTATITTSTTNNEGAKIFIDYNDNGSFADAGEEVATFPANQAGTRSIAFTTPTTGITLNKGLRLRVVSIANGTDVPTDACNNGDNGQIEDYTVAFPGLTPTITLSAAALTAFTSCAGTVSTEQTYTVSGANLTNDVVITAPTGFNVSLTTGTGFGASVTVTTAVANAGATTIFVRQTAAAANGASGNITHTSTGAVAQNKAIPTSVVNPLPNVGTQPSASTICAGANTTFTVAATGAGLTYQWQERVGLAPFTNITNGGVYSGATTATLTLTAATAGMNNNQYQCIVSGTCTPAATSNAVALTVNPLPTITGVSAANVNTAATTFNLAYTGVTNAPNQYSITTGTTAMAGFVAVTNATLGASPLAITIPASAANTYDFNLTVRNSVTGCVSAVVPFTLTVTAAATPTITLSAAALTAFTSCAGSVSAEQTYTVSGANLTNDVVITAPTGFNVSLTTGTGFGTSVTVTTAAANAGATTIFVRQTAAAANGANGNITHTSTGATAQNKAIPTSVVNATSTPTVGITPTAAVAGNQTFTATAANIAGGTVAYDFQKNSVSQQNGAANTWNGTGLVAGDVIRCVITVTGGTCLTATTATSNTVTVTAAPTPTITLSAPALTAFTSCAGTVSAEQTYTVSGANLTNDVVITAPTGFNVSLTTGAGFGTSVTVTTAAANAGATTIFVRQTAAAANGANGNITHTSTGATQQDKAIPVSVVNATSTPTVGITPTAAVAGTQLFTAAAANIAGGTVAYDFQKNSVSQQNSAATTWNGTGLVAGDVIRCVITVTGGTCLTTTTATSNSVTITAAPTPTITLSAPALTAFTSCAGTVSAEQTYTVSGANLTNDVVITAPTSFEISLTTGTGFASTLNLTQTGGNVATTTIFVRQRATATNGSIGNIVHVSVGSNNPNKAIPISVVNATSTPTVGITPIAAVAGTQLFTATAANIAGGTVVTYDFRLGGVTQQNNATNTWNATGLVAGNLVTCVITVTGGTCLTATTATSNTVTVTAVATPTITLSAAALTAFTSCAGSVSAEQTYTVSGANLTNDVVITAPTGFNVSLTTGTGFGASVTVTTAAANAGATTIFVRQTAAAANGANGNITHTSTGAAAQNKAIPVSVVNALPSITTQPTAQTVCANANATFTVVATGTGLTYRWQEKVGAGAFANITNAGVYSGATTATLTLTNPTAAMSTNQYQCIVSGTCTPGFVSSTVALTVTPVNATPTLDNLAALNLATSAPAQTVNLAGIGMGAGDAGQTLTVTATSSNVALIPNPTVTYTSPNATGSIGFTPVAAQTGTATITVTVTDNGGVACGAINNVVRTFTVNVGTPTPPPPPPAAVAQTITFDSIPNKTFGDADFTLVARASSNLPVNFEVLTGGTGSVLVSGNTVIIRRAGTVTIQATQSGNASFRAATPVSRTFTINKANQTINFGNLANVVWNGGSVNLSATSSVNLPVSFAVTEGNTIASLVNGNILQFTQNVGNVSITATQAGNENYNAATAVVRTFQVLPVPSVQHQIQVINAPRNVTFGTSSVTLNATANSGLPVTITLVSGNATLNGNVLTITGAGNIVLRFSQAGNATWEAATTVERTITVDRANQMITITPPVNMVVNTSQTLVATSSSGLPVVVSIVSGTGTVNGLTITPTAGNFLELEFTQVGNTNFNAAAPVRASLVVIPTLSFANASVAKACAGGNFTITYNVAGLFNSNNRMAVYLSDANGNFTNSRQLIGLVERTGGGTIPVVLPTNATSSNKYRIRVEATAPEIFSNSSGDFEISALPEVPTIRQENDALVTSATSGIQWFFDGVAIAGATSQRYTPTDAQIMGRNNYAVIVTNANDCKSTSSTFSGYIKSIPTSTTDPVLSSKLSVYPNPAQDKVLLELGMEKAGKVSVRMVDALGKEVYQETVTTTTTNLKHEITLTDMASGVYVLMVNVDGKVAVKRVVKQ